MNAFLVFIIIAALAGGLINKNFTTPTDDGMILAWWCFIGFISVIWGVMCIESDATGNFGDQAREELLARGMDPAAVENILTRVFVTGRMPEFSRMLANGMSLDSALQVVYATRAMHHNH